MSGAENANVGKCRSKFGREFPEVEIKDATVKHTENRFWFHASGRGGLRFHWYSAGGRKETKGLGTYSTEIQLPTSKQN